MRINRAMLLGLLVALCLVGCAAVCPLDRRFVYFPEPWEDGPWAAASRLPLEDAWFAASDGVRLHGWFVQAAPEAPVLLWCHGNAGNVINRLEPLTQLYRHGLSVFLFDYRGYGRSEGAASEPGLYRDAEAAYDWLVRERQVSPEHIILFGESLGAAVAGDLATKRPARALILQTPFPSIRSVVRAYYGWLPLELFLRARYDLAARLRRVRMPVLVIHGDRDSIIPLALGRRVYELALEPKTFTVVPGADHNDLFAVGGEPYFQRLVAFARSALH